MGPPIDILVREYVNGSLPRDRFDDFMQRYHGFTISDDEIRMHGPHYHHWARKASRHAFGATSAPSAPVDMNDINRQMMVTMRSAFMGSPGFSAMVDDDEEDEPEVKEKKRTKVTLGSIAIAQDKKEQIRAAIAQMKHTELIFEKWGFGEVFEKGTAVSLLFYGPPGTGKTLTAQAIADELGLELKLIGSGEVESSEPGQCERNIQTFFENAKEQKQLLLFDECDSLICDRNDVGMILGAQINALLTALEKYEGVVIFTTNRLGRMDPAFERRVSAKVEFPFPDEKQRKAIWQRLLPKKAPICDKVDLEKLAKFPLPGGNIKNAVLNAARFAAHAGKKKIDEECFVHAIKKRTRP